MWQFIRISTKKIKECVKCVWKMHFGCESKAPRHQQAALISFNGKWKTCRRKPFKFTQKYTEWKKCMPSAIKSKLSRRKILGPRRFKVWQNVPWLKIEIRSFAFILRLILSWLQTCHWHASEIFYFLPQKLWFITYSMWRPLGWPISFLQHFLFLP